MIQFIENTWFLWWIFAVVAIVRWFFILSNGTKVDLPGSSASSKSSVHSNPGIAR